MRRLVLAVGVALAALGTGQAHAQLGGLLGGIGGAQPVIDIKSIMQEIKAYSTQLQQLQTAVQQVMWATQTYQSLVAHPNLGSAMGLMGTLGIQDPLPVNPYAVQGLLNGSGGISGSLGALSSLANTSWAQNHVYTPTDGSWASQSMINNANGIAGSQAVAMQVYQQMGQHFAVADSLRQDLLNATTPAERESAMAQLQAEQTWTQNANGQLQAALVLASSEQASRGQQDNERLSMDFDQTLADARANGVNIP